MVFCLQIPTIFSVGGKKYFSQLLNVHRVSDVRQIEIRTAEVPDPSPSESEIAITKLKSYKSPGSDQIRA
jgi:hypothetical protein